MFDPIKINRKIVIQRDNEKIKELMKEYHMQNCPDDIVEEVYSSNAESDSILMRYLYSKLGVFIDRSTGSFTQYELSELFIKKIIIDIDSDLSRIYNITGETETVELVKENADKIIEMIYNDNEFDILSGGFSIKRAKKAKHDDKVEYIIYYLAYLRNLKVRFNYYLTDLNDETKSYESYYEFEA